MPTYEYECKQCQHKFEEFQNFSDKVLRKCPECGKRSLERLIGSGGAILFKGSGFYITDYRSKEYKDKAKADSDAQKTSESSSSDGEKKKKSESKSSSSDKSGGKKSKSK